MLKYQDNKQQLIGIDALRYNSNLNQENSNNHENNCSKKSQHYNSRKYITLKLLKSTAKYKSLEKYKNQNSFVVNTIMNICIFLLSKFKKLLKAKYSINVIKSLFFAFLLLIYKKFGAFLGQKFVIFLQKVFQNFNNIFNILLKLFNKGKYMFVMNLIFFIINCFFYNSSNSLLNKYTLKQPFIVSDKSINNNNISNNITNNNNNNSNNGIIKRSLIFDASTKQNFLSSKRSLYPKKPKSDLYNYNHSYNFVNDSNCTLLDSLNNNIKETKKENDLLLKELDKKISYPYPSTPILSASNTLKSSSFERLINTTSMETFMKYLQTNSSLPLEEEHIVKITNTNDMANSLIKESSEGKLKTKQTSEGKLKTINKQKTLNNIKLKINPIVKSKKMPESKKQSKIFIKAQSETEILDSKSQITNSNSSSKSKGNYKNKIIKNKLLDQKFKKNNKVKKNKKCFKLM